MKITRKKLICIVAALAVVAITIVGCVGWTYLRDNKLGNFEGKAQIYVRPEMTPEDVICQLESQTTIIRPKALKKVFKKKQVAEYITPGYYVISSKTSSVALARMLNNGWQTPVTMVISGTLRLKSELASKISKALMIDSSDVRKALDDKEFLSKYGFTPQTVFAMIIPDNYSCYWTASLEDIFGIFKKSYDRFWTDENKQKARSLKLSQMEVSILASIVQGETNYEPEQPKIAGVYLNRLRRGMPLQACPTVCFCYDYKINRVLNRHLQCDSPYNTYRYPGLPPGPICSPSKSCLNAVLNPDCKDGYLYFCANSDFSGTHLFARSSAEHAKNARAFQRKLSTR